MCFMFIFGNFIDAYYVIFVDNKDMPQKNSYFFQSLKFFSFYSTKLHGRLQKFLHCCAS